MQDCPNDEVPLPWREEHQRCLERQKENPSLSINHVDRSLTGLAKLIAPPTFQHSDSNSWIIPDQPHRISFVDLRKNPEQFTGYAGESAAMVWQAVYEENCFTFSDKCRSGICAPDTCKEERVLYHLISGLHASISMHIARRYLYKSGQWAPNVNVYKERLRSNPERIDNLNVAYAIVLQALSKASVDLHPSNYSYHTGNVENDQRTESALVSLYRHPLLHPQCEQKVFDESGMFESRVNLPQFRDAFRNISMIMDCVGCEKCRLWGKLQFLGLGTALKILFDDNQDKRLTLERNEVIALYNLLYKLSTSVMWVQKFEDMINSRARLMAKLGAIGACVVLCVLSVMLGKQSKKREKEKDEATGEPLKAE